MAGSRERQAFPRIPSLVPLLFGTIVSLRADGDLHAARKAGGAKGLVNCHILLYLHGLTCGHEWLQYFCREGKCLGNRMSCDGASMHSIDMYLKCRETDMPLWPTWEVYATAAECVIIPRLFLVVVCCSHWGDLRFPTTTTFCLLLGILYGLQHWGACLLTVFLRALGGLRGLQFIKEDIGFKYIK